MLAAAAAYPDEAVVEEETHEAGAIAGVSADGGEDDVADEVLRPWAGAVVVPDLQACLRRRDGGEDDDPRQQNGKSGQQRNTGAAASLRHLRPALWILRQDLGLSIDVPLMKWR